MKEGFIYTGPNTAQISFPLGGIGSGCIGLAGNGLLIDWEIRNHPDKRTYNNYSGFLVRAYEGERLVSARVLAGDLMPPYTGEPRRGESYHSGFGFGPPGEIFCGISPLFFLYFQGGVPGCGASVRGWGFSGRRDHESLESHDSAERRRFQHPCRAF